jgi:hypothetical protein
LLDRFDQLTGKYFAIQAKQSVPKICLCVAVIDCLTRIRETKQFNTVQRISDINCPAGNKSKRVSLKVMHHSFLFDTVYNLDAKTS